MIVLGIDTSGYVNAVGIADGSRVLADAAFPAETDSLEQIVDNIDSVLKSVGLSLKDVEGIGVGLGPGSWTGIKVGVTVGKILAFSTAKLVAGVPTLEALAYGARCASPLVYAVVNVGIKDTVYAALYRFNNSEVIREGEYFAGNIKELAGMMTESVMLVGSGVEQYLNIIIKENSSLKTKVKIIEATPSGAAVACLAASRLAHGNSDNALSLTPLYLKESTAKAFVNKYTVQ